MSDHVDEVEAALHFDEYKLTFCNVMSQSARSEIILLKTEKNEWSFLM